MKKTKKLLACLIAAATMFTMGSTAFAATTDQKTVTIKKVYKLTNDKTTSPAETFTLEQVGDGKVTDGEATSAPALGTITGATFAEGAATVSGTTGEITVALPTYDHVGIYEYTLKEKDNNQTAGVTYYGNDIKLVVTVIQGENGKLRVAAVHTESAGKKSDTFTNTYSAGKLNISKTVTGNLGDQSKYFEFKVTLTGQAGKNYADSYAVSSGTNTANPTSIKIGEETTFLLKHGETISIENLPYGVTYTVSEKAADGYTTTKTGDTGSVNAADQTAAFTNDKNSDNIDTGINLTTLPYILVFAGVIVIAGAAFITRRRKYED